MTASSRPAKALGSTSGPEDVRECDNGWGRCSGLKGSETRTSSTDREARLETPPRKVPRGEARGTLRPTECGRRCASSAILRATDSAISAYHRKSSGNSQMDREVPRRAPPATNGVPSPDPRPPPNTPPREALRDNLCGATDCSEPEAGLVIHRASSSASDRRTLSAISTATAASRAERPCNGPGTKPPATPTPLPLRLASENIHGRGAAASSASTACRQMGQVLP